MKWLKGVLAAVALAGALGAFGKLARFGGARAAYFKLTQYPDIGTVGPDVETLSPDVRKMRPDAALPLADAKHIATLTTYRQCKALASELAPALLRDPELSAGITDRHRREAL